MINTHKPKCKLCLESDQLANSHIIPEFMFKPLYKDGRRIVQISTDKPRPHKNIQKGIREKLLCYKRDGSQNKSCEHKLNEWETYAAEILNIKCSTPEWSDYKWLVKDVDYKKFKLFQLSLLWRASVSSLKEFENVSLKDHQEKIRKMLMSGNPGKASKYPCLIILSGDVNKWGQQVIQMPQSMRYDGNRTFWFILNGLIWLFFIPDNTYKKSNINDCIQQTDILPIIVGPDDMLTKILASFGKQWKNKK